MRTKHHVVSFGFIKKPIVYMAVGLVITTVVVVGYFINYIIPSISLGAAFALAAILSPTDAVAVKSITKGMKLPKGLMSILEGESLLNDAAGIVSFKNSFSILLLLELSHFLDLLENFLLLRLEECF